MKKKKKYGRTYLHIVQCTLYVASSVRQKFISVVVLTVVAVGGGGGGGGGGVGAVGNMLVCLTWLEKQSVMMNSFHQTE